MKNDLSQGGASTSARMGPPAVLVHMRCGLIGRSSAQLFLAIVSSLSILTAPAFGGDFADSRGPGPGRDSPAFPAWQLARLKSPETAPHRVDLPPTKALEQRQIEPSEGMSSGFKRIGYVEPFDQKLLPLWPLKARENQGAVAHVEFHSEGACGLRLRFEDFDSSAQIELRFYEPSGTTVLGPFRSPRLDEDGGWWSPTIFGETIGVELYASDEVVGTAVAPAVTKVAFIAEACNTTPGTALGCHNDVVCHPDWDNDQARGVALIYFVSGSGCGQCTGALLNRNPGDLSPLFMTANHCISTAGEADSVEVYWFYETPNCNGTPPATPAGQPRNLGSLRLKRYTDADWTLLGLYEQPVSGVRYLGWDANEWEYGETATGIHHPVGTFKRISFGESRGNWSPTFCDSSGANCFESRSRRIRYTDGTTEPGSSGSPIFDANGRMRGTLSGGPSGCPDISKYYGRFYLAWDNLRYYMGEGDIASPVYVNSGVAGDPGNDGDSERGTAGNPFNTVHEASYAVRSNDEIRIEPGNYNEEFIIWRPMTLQRNGASGVVVIGE